MPIAEITLAGRHVRLEPVSSTHLPALATHAGDREIWQYMTYARPDPQDALKAWFAQATVERGMGGLFFAVIDQVTGRAIGGSTYLDYSEKDRRVEIGSTWLGRAHWRTPANTEGKRLLLGHAFEGLEMNRVQLKTDARNLRSQRAIERLGAVKEGVLRSQMVMPDGYLRDTVMYSIIASEWPEVKARLDALLSR
jgi:RimJ/RimL family protein N-acetyltransferase